MVGEVREHLAIGLDPVTDRRPGCWIGSDQSLALPIPATFNSTPRNPHTALE